MYDKGGQDVLLPSHKIGRCSAHPPRIKYGAMDLQGKFPFLVLRVSEGARSASQLSMCTSSPALMQAPRVAFATTDGNSLWLRLRNLTFRLTSHQNRRQAHKRTSVIGSCSCKACCSSASETSQFRPGDILFPNNKTTYMAEVQLEAPFEQALMHIAWLASSAVWDAWRQRLSTAHRPCTPASPLPHFALFNSL